jgi:hypothetical protein
VKVFLIFFTQSALFTETSSETSLTSFNHDFLTVHLHGVRVSRHTTSQESDEPTNAEILKNTRLTHKASLTSLVRRTIDHGRNRSIRTHGQVPNSHILSGDHSSLLLK